MIHSKDSIICKAAPHKPAPSPRNNIHGQLGIVLVGKGQLPLYGSKKFGAQHCMDSKSSEFGIMWGSRSSEFDIVWAQNSS